jgi:hypothetical protein
MDWMTLTPGWLLLLVATLFLASCAAWTGVLVSVSRLSGRARMMADGPKGCVLALALYRERAMPLLVVSFLIGFVWLACAPSDRLRAHWVHAIGVALLAMAGLHVMVGSRAERVLRGSLRATQGEALRRIALLVSFVSIIAFAALRTTLVP